MRTIGETIKRLRDERKLSQQQLADELNFSRSTISMYESGERIPNDEAKEIICDFFNIDMNFLYGKTEIKNSYQNAIDNGLEEVKIIFDDYFPLHYCTNLSAGSFDELLNSEPDAVVYVPIIFQNKMKRLHAFKVNGNSMDNVIADGSIVVVETIDKNNIKDGTIVVAFLDGYATVKRIYVNGDNITLMPDSSDKKHQPMMFNGDNQMYIIGKVIWHMNPEDIAKKY